MPVYTYVAIAENGGSLSGEAPADSEEDLRALLARRGLIPQGIRRKRAGISLGRQSVRTEEFALFNQEFIALVRAGLTVPDALALAADRPDSPMLAGVLTQILADVRVGVAFSAACERHPRIFDRLYISALRTSERTGALASVLQRHHEYLRHRVAIQKKVRQALTYPAFLLSALGVILVVLFTFVMPRFAAMYANLDAELPLPTRMLMGVVSYAYVTVPAAVGLIAGITILWRRGTATPAGRLRVDTLRGRLPYIGKLVNVIFTAQLARSLATLLGGGTPLVEALQTATGSVTNGVHVQKLQQATQDVINGDGFANAVRSSDLMPAMAARMIEVGEASGGLDSMLAEVARFYEESLDTTLTQAMNLIEPVLMLLIGLIIGGVIIIMYLPVFHVADIIK